jgi:mannose-1-phosphate guanylyltransferase
MISKAFILAGGFGSRMGELTRDTPKPMLVFQGLPVLEHLVLWLRDAGVCDIAISVHYHKNNIMEYFGDGSTFGVSIRYIEETEPLGTAGALRLLGSWASERFFMLNADEFKDIDLQALAKRHGESGAKATIALTRVDDPSPYGVANLDGARIRRFVEKPRREDAPSNCINAGLYVIEPAVISYVPEGFAMIERHVFPLLADEGSLYAFPFDGQWFDTGTPERFATAEQNWKGFTKKS